MFTNPQPKAAPALPASLHEFYQKTGVLAFESKAGRFCVHLCDGVIQAVFVNGRPLRDKEKAKQLLLTQLKEKIKNVRFEDALLEDLRKGFDISIDELLPEVLAADEVTNPKGFWQKMLDKFASG